MISVRQILLWGALQYGLVVGDVFQQSRVLINASSTSTSTLPSTTVVLLGWPTHGPVFPSTSTIVTASGQSGTGGSSASSLGDSSIVSTSLSLSPVGISVASPTSTEPSLPWTGRVLTNSGLETSSTMTSSVSPPTSVASASPSISSTFSNPSSTRYSNTTSRSAGLSTPPLTSPTPTYIIVTRNLSIASTSFATSSSAFSPSATYTLFSNVSTCSTLSPGQPVTIWSIFPNTTTTTLTVTGNWSTSFTPLPEFTPPVYCPTFTPSAVQTSTDPALSLSSGSSVPIWILTPSLSKTTVTDSLGLSSTLFIPVPASSPIDRVTVTSITTSKNGITDITSVTLPSYGSGTAKTDKMTVDPSNVPSDTLQWSPQTEPSRSRPGNGPIPISTIFSSDPTATIPISTIFTGDPAPTTQIAPTPVTTIFAGNPAATTPITEVVRGITVIADPTKATIGSSTVIIGPTPKTVTVSGQVFTVLPNEIDGPSVIISIPTYTPGAVFVETPTPTTVNGISIGLGAGGGSSVVIGGTSYNIGSTAPEQTIVDKGQTIVVGSKGIIFDSTTITPAPAPPLAAATPTTNIAIVGGSIITAVGSTLAVIGGHTFTYGPNTPLTTTVFNGESITLGPSGIIFHGSTIGGTALNPSSSQIGIVGGVSITEIGSSLAVISGITFTIGPNATPTTTIIDNQAVSAGPNGFSDGSFTWNPFSAATTTPSAANAEQVQVLTAEGITFSELQSSLVVIGTKTFTFGPGASPTTDVYEGQTISIGPNGIGFSSTTFTSLPTNVVTSFVSGSSLGASSLAGAGAGSAQTTTSKKSAGAKTGSRFRVGVLVSLAFVVFITGGLL